MSRPGNLFTQNINKFRFILEIYTSQYLRSRQKLPTKYIFLRFQTGIVILFSIPFFFSSYSNADDFDRIETVFVKFSDRIDFESFVKWGKGTSNDSGLVEGPALATAFLILHIPSHVDSEPSIDEFLDRLDAFLGNTNTQQAIDAVLLQKFLVSLFPFPLKLSYRDPLRQLIDPLNVKPIDGYLPLSGIFEVMVRNHQRLSQLAQAIISPKGVKSLISKSCRNTLSEDNFGQVIPFSRDDDGVGDD